MENGFKMLNMLFNRVFLTIYKLF